MPAAPLPHLLLPGDVRHADEPIERLRLLAARAVAKADRVVARTTGGRRPIATELTKRSLWGPFHGGVPDRHEGQLQLGLSFDLDYQADTDALDGLNELVSGVGARMSVVSIAKLVEQDPGPYRRALTAGHEIVNHTWSHPDNPVLNPDREFWHLSVDEMVEEVERAQDVFEQVLGVRPDGFRTPHFKDAHRMLDALARVPEITWVSSVLATTTTTGLPFLPTREPIIGDRSHHVGARDGEGRASFLQLPLTACPEHRWSPLCSYHTIREPRDEATGAGMHDLAGLERLVAQAREDNAHTGYVVLYLDPMDVMRDDDTAATFRRSLTSAIADGWDVTTLGDVAATWRRINRHPVGGTATP